EPAGVAAPDDRLDDEAPPRSHGAGSRRSAAGSLGGRHRGLRQGSRGDPADGDDAEQRHHQPVPEPLLNRAVAAAYVAATAHPEGDLCHAVLDSKNLEVERPAWGVDLGNLPAAKTDERPAEG